MGKPMGKPTLNEKFGEYIVRGFASRSTVGVRLPGESETASVELSRLYTHAVCSDEDNHRTICGLVTSYHDLIQVKDVTCPECRADLRQALTERGYLEDD